MSTNAPDEVLLLRFTNAYKSMLNESYSQLLTNLSQHTQLQRTQTGVEALHYLMSKRPRAVILPDADIAEKKNMQVLRKVVEYLKNGGTVIAGLLFPVLLDRDKFDILFTNLGVSWTNGDYHRTTVVFNPTSTLPNTVPTRFLPKTCSLKCVFLKGTNPEERIYAPTNESRTESHVFSPERVDTTQAAAAGCKVGDGYLAYVGDVNGELGSTKLIEALCGVSVP